MAKILLKTVNKYNDEFVIYDNGVYTIKRSDKENKKWLLWKIDANDNFLWKDPKGHGWHMTRHSQFRMSLVVQIKNAILEKAIFED